MPRRSDIHKILILGSGPIVIGQAAEFDYSGVQACKVLREEGYEIVLVNSNPATIMTDPEFADATYIEPLLPGPVAQVIERERPDALLRDARRADRAEPGEGAARRRHAGQRYGVELIGANYEAIACAEDRELFGAAMARRACAMPSSAIATTVAQALAALASRARGCRASSAPHTRSGARRRHRAHRGRVRADRRARASRPRRSARCCSTSRSSAGASSSWR